MTSVTSDIYQAIPAPCACGAGCHADRKPSRRAWRNMLASSYDVSGALRGPRQKPGASTYMRKYLSLRWGTGRKPSASFHTRKRNRSLSLSLSFSICHSVNKREFKLQLHVDDAASNVCPTLPHALPHTRSKRSTRRARSPPGRGANPCSSPRTARHGSCRIQFCRPPRRS